MDDMDEELRRRFSYHPPTDEQIGLMRTIRGACFSLASLIAKSCPDSREKADALTNLDYVMYQANAAITRRGVE